MAAVLPAKRPRALTDGVDSLGGVNQNSRVGRLSRNYHGDSLMRSEQATTKLRTAK
jgi:hypothetical protein